MNYNYSDVVKELYTHYESEGIESELRYFCKLTWKDKRLENKEFKHKLEDTSVLKGAILKYHLKCLNVQEICVRCNTSKDFVIKIINLYLSLKCT